MLLIVASFAHAVADETEKKLELGDATLQDLMNIEVTSVSKKQQKLSRTPAAVYVISKEEIRRSGFRTIPDLLRLAPGVQVARINATEWAISARGFNGRWSNKLLVMIDGRTVYSPLSSGVYWEGQDALLEDIERIEMIRGPGAAIWGANAVNGVINIVTRDSKDTEGGLAVSGAGTEERASAALRYGGKLGSNGHYRVYSKYFDRQPNDGQKTNGFKDSWSAGRAGFRMDWEPSNRDTFMVEGDFMDSRIHGAAKKSATPEDPAAKTVDYNGSPDDLAFNGRWKRTLSEHSDMEVHAYYDRSRRSSSSLSEARDTADVEFQHRFDAGTRNEFLWGLEARVTADELQSRGTVSFTPNSRRDGLYSAFVQDEIVVVPDRLRLSLGAKLEHNAYSGSELQPGIQLAWTPDAKRTMWASIARAVRSPSRSNSDIAVILGAFQQANGVWTTPTLTGNPQLKAEELLAFDAGHRVQYKHVSFDVAAFYNLYTNLIDTDSGKPFFQALPTPPRLVLPIVFQNNTTGNSYGVEVSTVWEITSRWKVNSTYSLLRLQLHGNSPAANVSASVTEGENPQNQGRVSSYFDITRKLSFDTAVYAVGRLTSQALPGYCLVNARVAWRFTNGVEASVQTENLLDRRHFEFLATDGERAARAFGRTVFGKITWRF